jgi:hypothetical protein
MTDDRWRSLLAEAAGALDLRPGPLAADAPGMSQHVPPGRIPRLR